MLKLNWARAKCGYPLYNAISGLDLRPAQSQYADWLAVRETGKWGVSSLGARIAGLLPVLAR